MSNIEWLEKRRRAARCKIHGLHYDPSMTSGCILCRKEGLLKEKRKGPQLVMLLLAILGMTVAAFQIYGPVTNTFNELRLRTFPLEAEPPPAPPDATVSRVAPTEVRADLERFEKALFAPNSDQMAGIQDDILTSGQMLILKLRDLDNPQGPKTASEVNSLLELVNSGEFDLKHLEKVRARWFQTRADSFQAAPWFRAPASSDELDRARVAVYREIAGQLQDLILDGSSNSADPTAWSAFAQGWEARIQELKDRLPSRPGAAADAQFLLAVQQLEQSLSDLHRIASGSTTPPPASRFEQIDQMVEQVLRTLDDLLL